MSVTIRLSPDGPAVSRDSAAVLDLLRQLTELDRSHRPATALPAAGVDVSARRDAGAPPPGRRAHPAGLHVHPDSRTVYRGGDPVALTRIEFDLLLHLTRNRRQVLTRRQLLDAVWGSVHVGERTVDVHVQRLRAKVGDGRPLVTTVRGVGYRLHDGADVVLAPPQG
ncbi:winged helix family transcriptional regulator [Micromonospora echinofusca]|uniref:Winged helix family transcriptional regulator n=2 Tax=Micromonospora echinofusca TaxID=47858 RepID=A0ABS3VSR9_MICEH|nr:winged helix family transcriptional regulator [Micromonospora echinofusca]